VIAAAAEEHIAEAGERKHIPLDLLDDSPFNPRKTFNPKKVADIANSMKAVGQIQPIVARAVSGGRFEIAAGHTRKRAAVEADLGTLDAIVRDLDDDEMIIIGLTENGDREDLPPLEEADAYKALIDRGWTVDRIVDGTGKSDAHVRRRLQLTKVCAAARQAVVDGKLLANAAAALARLESEKDQLAVLDRVLKSWKSGDKPWSADDIEFDIKARTRILSKAPFDVKDKKLVDGAKACAQCPKRTQAQAEIFPENVDENDRCLDGDCWSTKLKAHDDAFVERAKKRGLQILDADASKRVFPGGTNGAGTAYTAPSFIALDAECYVGHVAGVEPKKWGDLVKGDDGRFVAFDGEGRPHEVMKEADAKKAAGIKPPEKPRAEHIERAARDDEGVDDDDMLAGDLEVNAPRPPPPPVRSLEDENAIVKAIVERCVKKQDLPVWKMLRVLVDPDGDWEAIARRRGWSEDIVDTRLISPPTLADAVGLFVEALIAGPTLEGQRDIALQQLGMDAEEILGRLKAKKAAAKSKAKAKKPPPKKKPAKKGGKKR
jgi:ParB/RepB/Spo0J family partition protein